MARSVTCLTSSVKTCYSRAMSISVLQLADKLRTEADAYST